MMRTLPIIFSNFGVCLVLGLLQTIKSFSILPTTGMVPNPIGSESSQRRRRRKDLFKIRENSNDEIEEAERLQAELNKLTSDIPMFSSFDASNVDQSAVPIPAFTATVIFLGSLAFTFYLYDVGLNGFPTN